MELQQLTCSNFKLANTINWLLSRNGFWF